MLRQLGCATTASTNAHWSRTSCSSARHCTGDNQGSGLCMVLSKIGCQRRYSTSFGTFDLLFGILCTCTSYLCCIRMHEPVLVSMRRPRRYSKKCTCTWLTLVSQSLVKFKKKSVWLTVTKKKNFTNDVRMYTLEVEPG